MNVVNALQRRQHGLSNELNYDFALRRLSVAKEDSWRGIAPSNDSSDYNPEPPIFSAKFANCDGYRHILAIANEDGKIALQDATKLNYEGDERSLSGPQCHHNAVFDLEWAPGQMKFVSASGDHTARLWEVTNSDIRQIKPFLGHNRSVKTAAFRRNDSSVFATGGRDGAILIWDTRANLNVDFTPRADNCIYSGHAGGPGTPVSQRKSTRTPKIANTTSSSITGLAFQDANTLVSCGAGDGIIKVWDLRRNYTSYKREPLPKHSLPYAGTSTFKGFTNLLIDEAGARLFANCMDNTIYCYNLFSYEAKPLASYKGLLNSTFYIKSCLSPDGKYLLSGSSDEKAYIWNLDYPAEPLVALCGHNVEVTCVAWGAANDRPIVTCSDDARHKIWRIGPEELTDNERQEHYRGHAEFVRKFGSKNTRSTSHKYNLRDLDATPRSLKRLVEQNERTPGSMEKVSQKRSFLDMLGMNASHEGNDERETKRSKTMESKGRRLFSPCPNSTINNRSIPNSEKARCLNIQLSAIPEESPSTSSAACLTTSPLSRHQSTDSNNQENSNQPPAMPCSKSHTTMPLSELSVQHNQNQTIYNSPPASMPTASTTSATGSSQQSQLAPISSAIYSPTSNLPNYVLDGEAPHLGIMSPKRKAKDKVDWLTKIRKQKLMSSCRGTTLTEKVHDEHEMMQAANVHSPRIQSLRNSEGSPRSSPRRRISHSGLHHQHHAHHDGSGTTPTPKTPTSSRRNSETTILRFFSVQRAQSTQPTAASALSRTTQEDGGHRIDSLTSSAVVTSTTSAFTQQQLLHTTAAAPSTATTTCTE